MGPWFNYLGLSTWAVAFRRESAADLLPAASRQGCLPQAGREEPKHLNIQQTNPCVHGGVPLSVVPGLPQARGIL